MNAPPHSLSSHFPTASLSPSSKLTLVPPHCPSDLLVSLWSVQAAHLPFFPMEQNVFLHSWTIAGRTGNCHLSWISWVQSCPGKPSLGFLMPLGLSSLLLHLSPSEVQHRGKQEEPAQRRWGCADLLLPGRGWSHVSAQLPGFPQEKEQIWSNIWDHAVGTGTLAVVRR